MASVVGAQQQVDAMEEEELWFVQLPGGLVRAWTLDELDAAFQSGRIDEHTLVRQGSEPWAPLSEVAGLGAEEPQAPAPVSSVMAVAVPSYPASNMPLFSAPPPPVVTELSDLDELPREFRSGKRRLFVGLAVAALAICGAGVAFTKLGATADAGAASATVAHARAEDADAAPVAAPPPPPAPVAVDPPKGAPLTDQQKKALLDADKNRERAVKDRKAKAPPPARRAPKSANPFHKGGSKMDPLNSSI